MLPYRDVSFHMLHCVYICIELAIDDNITVNYSCILHVFFLFPSGGHMTLGDSFTSALFKQTYHKVFSKDYKGEFNMAFNATFSVKVYFSVTYFTQFVCTVCSS